jgi:hypothetical protein
MMKQLSNSENRGSRVTITKGFQAKRRIRTGAI